MKDLFLAAVATLAAALLHTGCTQTERQRAEDRYWNAVTNRLDFNRGTPRRQTMVEVRTTRTTRATESRQTVADK